MFEEKIPQFNNRVQPIEPRPAEEKHTLKGVAIPEPEDIFAKTEKESAKRSNGKVLPKAPSLEVSPKRKWWIVLLVIVLLVGLGAMAGWLFYRSQKPEVQSQKSEKEVEKIEVKRPAVVEPPLVEIDTDGDGLSDEEERQLGTDLSKPDTDEDGLFDREETKVWQTDPLNPDTDGDGYLDGEEVGAGFNPKGSGRWKKIETKD